MKTSNRVKAFALALIGFIIPSTVSAQQEVVATRLPDTFFSKTWSRPYGPLMTAALAEAEGPLRPVEARLAQTATPVVPATPRRNWAVRHPVLLGTLIGAGAAVALIGKSGGTNAMIALPFGAGAGATGGLVASTIQTARLNYDAEGGRPDVAAVKRVVAAFEAGQRITVTEVSSVQTGGRIQAIREDELALVPDGRDAPVEIAYADIRAIRRIQPAGVKIGIGAAVAGAIGIGLMCSAYCGGN